MFITTKYPRSTKPYDAMYAWLENLSSGGFELCIREFLPFDGKHQGTSVVSRSVTSDNATLIYIQLPANAPYFSVGFLTIILAHRLKQILHLVGGLSATPHIFFFFFFFPSAGMVRLPQEWF